MNKKVALLPSLLIFLVGVYLFYPQFMYGPLVVNDSLPYLIAAKNLSLGNGFVSHDGKLYSNWPPLYPSILSIFYLFDDYLYKWGGITINVLSYIIAIVYVNRILTKLKIESEIILYLLVFCFTSLYSVLVFSCYLSESIYVAFTLVSIIFLYNFLLDPTKINLLVLIISSWVCSLQRYSGIFLIIFISIIIIVFYINTFKTRIKVAFLYFSISVIPLLMWMVRNIITVNKITGADRTTEFKYLEYNIVNLIQQSWEWFLPYWERKGTVFVFGFILFSIVLLIFIKIYNIYKLSEALLPENLLFVILLFHSIGYMLFMTFTSLIQSSSAVDPRLSSPGYFTALPVFGLIINNLYLNTRSCKFVSLFYSALIFFFIYSCSRGGDFLYDLYDNKLGYNSKDWRNSETLEFLKEQQNYINLRSSSVYTNSPEAIYYYQSLYVNNITQEYKDGILHRSFIENRLLKTVIWFGAEEKFIVFMTRNSYHGQFYVLKRFSDGLLLKEIKK